MGFIERPTWNSIVDIVRKCEHDLLLCSPYITQAGLHAIRPELSLFVDRAPHAHIRIWTKLTEPINDVPGILSLMKEFRDSVEVSEHPDLHAKLYASDGENGVIGSPNLTKAGLPAHLDLGNYELIVICDHESELARVKELVDELGPLLYPVSIEHLQQFVDTDWKAIIEWHEKIDKRPIIHPPWRAGRSLRMPPRQHIQCGYCGARNMSDGDKCVVCGYINLVVVK